MYRKASYLFTKFFTALVLICVASQLSAQEEAWVKIHYLGHAAFVMEFDNGVKIVSDYGHYNAWVAWGWDSPIHDIGELVPDIMTYSHFHDDHYDPDRIPPGVPHILSEMDSLEYNGITILPIRTCETSVTIESNTSFLFTYKNLKILHLGDAQAQIIDIRNLTTKLHIMQIIPSDLDMLFMTIEGQTQFISQAEEFVRLLSPKRIIPIHHWSETYLDEFLDYLETKNLTGSTYQISDDDSTDYLLNGEEIASPTKVIALKRSPYVLTTNLEGINTPVDDFELYQNYPNPFNPETRIPVRLTKPSAVSLTIFNVAGERIKTLFGGFLASGAYDFRWDSRDNTGKPVSTGLYIYRINCGGILQERKMMLIK